MSKLDAGNRSRLVKAFDFILKTHSNGDRTHSAQEFAELEVQPGEYLFKMSDDVQGTMQTISEIHDLSFLIRDHGALAAWDYLTKIVIPKLREQREIIHHEPDRYTVTPYSEIIFLSPLLQEERYREEIALTLNKDEGPLTDIASCGKCSAPKVHRKVAQTRSADEGMTSIFTCPECRFGWSEN